jgi:hypothetical protein
MRIVLRLLGTVAACLLCYFVVKEGLLTNWRFSEASFNLQPIVLSLQGILLVLLVDRLIVAFLRGRHWKQRQMHGLIAAIVHLGLAAMAAGVAGFAWHASNLMYSCWDCCGIPNPSKVFPSLGVTLVPLLYGGVICVMGYLGAGVVLLFLGPRPKRKAAVGQIVLRDEDRLSE